MSLEPFSNKPSQSLREGDNVFQNTNYQGEEFEGSLPIHFLNRESYFPEHVVVRNIDGGKFFSFCRALRIPITPEGADSLVESLAQGLIPWSRTFSKGVKESKVLQFRGKVEIVAGNKRVTQSYGFQLIGSPEGTPDFTLYHTRGEPSASIMIGFELSEMTRATEIAASWRKLENLLMACGTVLPQSLPSSSVVGYPDNSPGWYQVKLNDNAFISMVPLVEGRAQFVGSERGTLEGSIQLHYQPRMILFNSCDEATLGRVIDALSLAANHESLSQEKNSAVVRLIEALLASVARRKASHLRDGEISTADLGDCLFEFAGEKQPLSFEVRTVCEVVGGWRPRKPERHDCIEARISGLAAGWKDACTLVIRQDPNQSSNPLLFLEWDQGSVDQIGGGSLTCRQISSFLARFSCSRTPVDKREDLAAHLIRNEILKLPAECRHLLVWPVSFENCSFNLGFYERMLPEGEAPIL